MQQIPHKNKKEEFAHFLQTGVNPEQYKAITHVKGPLLVISGAGSGKTRVITARMTHLILDHHVQPSAIVALTFTNKAAKEMKERVQHFLDSTHHLPTVATFHSYSLQILKRYQHLLPFTNFSILDGTDQAKILQNVLKTHGAEKRFNARQLLYMISAYKNTKAVEGEFDTSSLTDLHLFMQVYNAYEKEKRDSHSLDFDDLLIYTLDLFKKNKEFKETHQRLVRHILVDEYQDTNTIQNALLKEMTLIPKTKELAIDSLCAVGDEDQSIYSWRGATVSNILGFHNDFNHTEIIKIQQNYRSTQHILEIANSIISQNTARNHKELWSTKPSKHTTIRLECLSEFQEADAAIACINALKQKEPLQSIAILYRTHYQSRVVEEQLIKHSIPYKIIGGIQFYERKEIKDLLAYLRLIVNPFDRVAFFRVINYPARGLGQKFEEEFTNLWTTQPLLGYAEIAQLMIDQGFAKGAKQTSLLNFVKLLSNFTAQSDAAETVAKILESTAYIATIKDEFEPEEAQTKVQNIQEFIRAIEHFAQTGAATIQNFLDEVSLLQDRLDASNQAKDYVQLMTLHGAKGLEFPNVIIVGVEDGILPSSQSLDNPMGIEEERRLLYVGITRSKDKLLLTHSKYRNTYGQTSMQQASRFLEEIPTSLLIAQSANYWNRTQFATFFTQWAQGSMPLASTSRTQTYSKPPIQANATPKSSGSDKQKKWKPMLTVQHKKFGYGVTHEVEEKNNKFYITVRFTMYGIKKIDGDFLEII